MRRAGIIFIFLSAILLQAQSPVLDSLKAVIKNTKSDTVKLNTLFALTETETDENIWPGYNQQMMDLAGKRLAENPKEPYKRNYEKNLAYAINNKGYILMTKGDYKEAIVLFKKSLVIQERIDEKKGIGYALTNLGLTYHYMESDTLAVQNLERAYKVLDEIKNFQILSYVINNLALIYDNQGDVPMAISSYHRSLKIAEESNDQKAAAYMLNNIANLYLKQGDYKSAKKYFEESRKNCERRNDKEGLISALLGIARAYENEKNPDECERIYRKAIALSIEIGARKLLGSCYNNMGTLMRNRGMLDSCMLYYNRSLQLRQEIGDKKGVCESYHNIGMYYFKAKNYTLAEEFGVKSLDMARSAKNVINMMNASRLLRNVYDAKKEPVKAYEMYKLYIKMRDSLDSEQNKRASITSAIQYEYGKKALADSLKTLNEKNIAKATLEKEQSIRYFLIAGLLLVVLFGIFMFNRFKITQKQKKIIEIKNKETLQQKHIIEEKQKEIVDSINYARRIQQSLLANDALLNNYLPQHFVFFKPKDIVSGDFYWATMHQDLFFMAICDSTGHGVPGAFMSLLNIGFMSEAIKEKGILSPEKIFDYVRARLIESISRDGQRDGFDGILVCFDFSKKKITYAAANNAPMLLNNGKLVQLSTDKMPVGMGERNENFNIFTIDYTPNSTIYFYTDGYADQFGGPKGKKFMYKKLNELLFTNTDKSLEDQKEILKDTFDAWRGKLEQVDDVCVIGIRI